MVQKAKGIFANSNTSQTNNGRLSQLVSLLTGDNGLSTTLTPVDVMKEYKSWIYSCSNINAAGVASTPLRLYATTQQGQSNKYLHDHRVLSPHEIQSLKGHVSLKALTKITPAVEVIEIVDHPLLDVLRNFNDNRNFYESMEGTSIGLDMIGNSYWYMDFKGMATPQDLYLLMPQYMKVIPGQRKLVKGYVYDRPNSTSVGFTTKEIIHFLTPNPNDPLYGLGCAQAAAMAIERNGLIDTSENSALKNKARPDAIVKYRAGKLDTVTKRDTERMWNNAYRGARKTGKIKVMDEDFDILSMPNFKPEEMGYPEGRKWTLKEVAAAFGVPYSMLDSSDTKKATSESAKLWHSQNALVPRLKRIEEKLNERLVPYYDDRLFLAFDDVIPENVEQKTRTNDTYIKNGVMSINEVRRSLGLMPYPDAKYEEPIVGGFGNNIDNTEKIEVEESEDEE